MKFYLKQKTKQYKLSYEKNKNLYKTQTAIQSHTENKNFQIKTQKQTLLSPQNHSMIGIEDIFHKIRQICQICYQTSQEHIKIPRNYKNVALSSPQRPKQIPQVIIKQYLTALQYLEYFTQQLKDFKNQYESLQQSLQKQQLQIRKHIGIQQQLRLYTESIKAQLEECQKEKLQLLENSKITIKNLKLKNEMLFEELSQLKKKKTTTEYQKVTKTYQHTSVKSKVKQKSLSASGQRKDSSLNKIIKTQYIERQKVPFLNANIRKQLKYKTDTEYPDKKHKHHKSTFIHQEPRTSQSKKKHRLELLEKGKKQKYRYSNSKQLDLGMYINKNELKKSPFKNIDKSSNKQQKQQQSSKKTQKQQKNSLHERLSKPQQKGHQNKQKSKSKQSKKKIKSKQHLKQKFKQVKKAPNHNRSLFSVSSVEYRTHPRNVSQK